MGGPYFFVPHRTTKKSGPALHAASWVKLDTPTLIYLSSPSFCFISLAVLHSCTLHMSNADRLWIHPGFGLSLHPTLWQPSNLVHWCWPLLDFHCLAVRRHAASTHHEPRNAPLPPSSTQTLYIRLAINTNMHIWNILCYATESSNIFSNHVYHSPSKCYTKGHLNLVSISLFVRSKACEVNFILLQTSEANWW